LQHGLSSQSFDAELFGQQALLRLDVVGDSHARKVGTAEGIGRLWGELGIQLR
jgi:hypothetical protein